MTINSRTLLRIISAAVAAFAPSTFVVLLAQPVQHFEVTAGATVLPFSTWSGSTVPAAIATVHVSVVTRPRWSTGLSVRAIKPLEVTSVAADCIPDVVCPSFRSPDALFGGMAEVAITTRGRRLRGSLGAGFISAQNLSDITATNSPAIEAGIEYAFLPTRRVSPVVNVRLQQLTRNVAGLQTIVLPGFGVVF